MKQIPIEFLQMIDDDINDIESMITSEVDLGVHMLKLLHMKIDGKYQACIKDWGKSMYGYRDEFGFCQEGLTRDSLVENLFLMQAKLEAYRFQVNAVPNIMPPITSIAINVNNNMNLFDSARSEIENNTSLSQKQTQEAIDKIDEIKKIITSEGSKKTKWEKAKPILIWLADKSFDVGMALLPLLLKL